MICALAAVVALTRPVDFPPSLIETQFQQGVTIYRQGKGLERVLQRDRQPVGWWFNGRIKEAVEEVIWISPELTSRWLGFLWAKEKWASGEAERRYDCLRNKLEGRLLLVVRLSSLPTLDWFGEETPKRPSYAEPHPIRFSLSTGPTPPSRGDAFSAARSFDRNSGDRIPLSPLLMASVRGRAWSHLRGYEWYRHTELLWELWPEFESDSKSGFIGSYESSFYLLSTRIPDGIEPEFRVHMFSPDKERVARFTLWKSD